MLFNLCNCVPGSSLAASSLCAGGAGFVTAMMATLAANNRTQAAKTFARRGAGGGHTGGAHDH